MSSKRTIRKAISEDEAKILDLLGSTSSSANTTSNEVRIYQILKAKNLLVLSLVAVDEEQNLLAFAALSPITVQHPEGSGFEDWYALGPILVHKGHRRHGIGTEIIRSGLETVEQDLSAKGVVANGFPSFLRRGVLGFRNAADQGLLAPDGTSSTYFWARRFARDDNKTQGKVRFAWQ